MAQVRRPVPFRTRKLRPGTAMVLHPTGCGRVARRRTTRTGSPLEHTPQGASSHTRNAYDPNPHTPTKTPGAFRTHETHVRDLSRPAPPPGPKRDGAARSHFRRKSGKQHVRDRGIPTPGPPPPGLLCGRLPPPEGSQKLAWLWGRSTLASAMHYFTPKRCATSNKIMYHDKAQVQRAADQSLIERGVELWVYRCEFCGCWHLTHRDPQSSYRHVPLNQQLKPHSRKKGYKPRRR